MQSQPQSPADWQVEHSQIDNLISLVSQLTITNPERLPTWDKVIHVWPSTVGLGSGLLLPSSRRLQKLYAANYSNNRIYLHLQDSATLPGNVSTIRDRVYHVDPGSVLHLDRNFWDETGGTVGSDSTSGLLFANGLAVVPSPTRLNVTYFPGAINDLTLELSGSN